MKKVAPFLIFIFVQLASIAVLTLWIVWYALSRSEFSELSQKYGLEPPVQINVLWLLQGIFLMLPVMIGASLIFVFWRKSRALEKTKSDFISSVTHELLTPIASLKLHLETLTMREVEKKERENFYNLMIDDSNRLESLISDLLKVIRIERKKELYHFENLDLNCLIREFLDREKKLFEGATIKLDLEGELYSMLDYSSMETVLKNLLENAIKYNDSKPEIEIKSYKKDEKSLFLEVKDNGIGINKKELNKVFKIFYRGRVYKKGTGIGLFIVRNIVKGHKGKIYAISDGPNQGTTFNIKLPLINGV